VGKVLAELKEIFIVEEESEHPVRDTVLAYLAMFCFWTVVIGFVILLDEFFGVI